VPRSRGLRLTPSIDRAVIEFVGRTVFRPGDFTITARGVCRLHPELARALVREVGVSREVSGTISELPGLLQLAADPLEQS
jgi:hypothetical protein